MSTAIAGLGLIAAVRLCRGLGALLIQAAHDRGGQRPRAAHLASPGVLDFITPLEVWWPSASALIVLAVIGYAAATAGDSGQLVAALLVLGAGALLWGGVELLAFLVARARPAASDVQSLAFDDALRAESLRPMFFAACFPLFFTASAGHIVGLPPTVTYVLFATFIASCLALGIVESTGQARRRFRQRLWAPRMSDTGTLSR